MIVWPSGAALASSRAASAPLAPGRFSTVIGTPSSLVTSSASARPIRSVLPPGSWPISMLIGPLGNSSAVAGWLPPPTLPPQAASESVKAKPAPSVVQRRARWVLVMSISSSSDW